MAARRRAPRRPTLFGRPRRWSCCRRPAGGLAPVGDAVPAFARDAREHGGGAVGLRPRRSRPGADTDTLPGGAALYLPLAGRGPCLGVLGIELPTRRASARRRTSASCCEALARQAALASSGRGSPSEAERGARRGRDRAAAQRAAELGLARPAHAARRSSPARRAACWSSRRAAARAGAARAGGDHRSRRRERLNRLVGNLLDMTRLESGRDAGAAGVALARGGGRARRWRGSSRASRAARWPCGWRRTCRSSRSTTC